MIVRRLSQYAMDDEVDDAFLTASKRNQVEMPLENHYSSLLAV